MIKSYNELPVGKYLEIRDLLKEEREDIDLQVSILSVLSDLDENEVLNLPIGEYSKLVRESNFLSVKPQFKAKAPDTIQLNGVKYNVCKRGDKMTAGQYIDYQTYMKMDDPDSKLAEVLSIFLIPEGKKYNENYDIEDVQEAIREYLPINMAMGICFFLRKRSLQLLSSTLISLRWMMKLMRMKERNKETKELLLEAEKRIAVLEDLQKNMVGLTQLTGSAN